MFSLCIRHASAGGDRAVEGYSGDGRDVCSVDAPPAFRLRHGFPARQVSSGAEQSDGIPCSTNGVFQESRKLWYISGPAITQTFAGHLGDLELAAVSIENSVIAGLSFGIMVREF